MVSVLNAFEPYTLAVIVEYSMVYKWSVGSFATEAGGGPRRRFGWQSSRQFGNKTDTVSQQPGTTKTSVLQGNGHVFE